MQIVYLYLFTNVLANVRHCSNGIVGEFSNSRKLVSHVEKKLSGRPVIVVVYLDSTYYTQ